MSEDSHRTNCLSLRHGAHLLVTLAILFLLAAANGCGSRDDPAPTDATDNEPAAAADPADDTSSNPGSRDPQTMTQEELIEQIRKDSQALAAKLEGREGADDDGRSVAELRRHTLELIRRRVELAHEEAEEGSQPQPADDDQP